MICADLGLSNVQIRFQYCILGTYVELQSVLFPHGYHLTEFIYSVYIFYKYLEVYVNRANKCMVAIWI